MERWWSCPCPPPRCGCLLSCPQQLHSTYSLAVVQEEPHTCVWISVPRAASRHGAEAASTAASEDCSHHSSSPACTQVNSLEFWEPLGNHRWWLSSQSHLPVPHPGSLQCFPLVQGGAFSLLFCSSQQVVGSERWLRGGCCLLGWRWVLEQDQGKKKVCQKGEEMKEWLPPTSTPSLNTLRSPGSSQNNPTLRHLPLSCHTSYLHFKMGFSLCDSEPQAVPLLDELPHLNTHLPSSKNIPPTRDYRAKVAWRGTCLSPLLDLLSLIADLTLPF